PDGSVERIGIYLEYRQG
ncbi:unnamed protein product, partial [Rotaria sordida]